MTIDLESNSSTLKSAFVAELYGAVISSEAAWEAVKTHVSAQEHERAADALVAVEKAKAQALRPLLTARGIEIDEQAARDRGRGWGALYPQVENWRQFWTGWIPSTEPWLRGMEFLQSISDEDDRTGVSSLIRYEECLLDFARLESTGADGGTALLESVISE
ncbi:hypothetical protein [Rhodococcus sp. NBC_00297]|uniref:hypothetical protein n=1 Tax=Rhodococcus sp. NBC_00297 TaxID=2976005 RepID=UPI002E2B4AB5|nr:hypothetical protein [Rhodococcus sp. NBC_00297]